MLYFAGLSIELFSGLDIKIGCLDRLGHCLDAAWTLLGRSLDAFGKKVFLIIFVVWNISEVDIP